MWPNPFTPLFSGPEEAGPVVIAASTTASAATALPGNPAGDGANPDFCIENLTNGWAFCEFGDASVPAATLSNGVGVPPNWFRIVRMPPTTCFVSVILNTGATAGSVRIIRGAGMT